MKQKGKLYQIVLLIVFALLLTSCGSKSEKAKKIMEKHLLKKYGEEFVVRYVGQRSADGEKFYEGEIFPKSIIGTPRENDKYYYASASVDVLFGGFLDREAGDSYSYIKRNDDVEEYLLPKAKELFGDMIRMKVNAQHKVTGDGSWWAGKKTASFEQMRKEVEADPEHERMQLSLYIYIFDRIDDVEEEEKRREEIFQFIQYLKKEDLFEYLELNIKIINEEVLAPSYVKYRKKLISEKKFPEYINGEKLYLPPKKLIREMNTLINNEIKNMSEEEKINSMKKLLKSQFDIEEKYFKYYDQYLYQTISLKYLEEVDLYGRYDDAKKEGILEKHKYKSINDIEEPGWYQEYIDYILREEK